MRRSPAKKVCSTTRSIGWSDRKGSIDGSIDGGAGEVSDIDPGDVGSGDDSCRPATRSIRRVRPLQAPLIQLSDSAHKLKAAP